MWVALFVVREGQGCWSAGEHDEGEGGLGGVEAVGASGHRADLVVQSFVAPVRQLPFDRGGDPGAVSADRGAGLDELRDPAALGPGAPPLEEIHDVTGGQVAGEDRA